MLISLGILAVLAGCTSRPPISNVPAAAKDQTPAWPQATHWRAQGRLQVTLPGGPLVGTVHLLAMDGKSLRCVLLADGGVVIDDLLMTISDQRLPASGGESAPLRHLAPALRHAFLHMREEERQWQQQRWQAKSPIDGSTRVYSGDPLTLRLAEGHWGWVFLSDHRLVNGELRPHHLHGQMGPIAWNLRLQSWGSIDQPPAEESPQ